MISDGTQTLNRFLQVLISFESDVISDGTQTNVGNHLFYHMFESDVISDGAQTQIYSAKRPLFRH